MSVQQQARIQEKNEPPQNFPVSRFYPMFSRFFTTFPRNCTFRKFFKVCKCERCGSLNPRLSSIVISYNLRDVIAARKNMKLKIKVDSKINKDGSKKVENKKYTRMSSINGKQTSPCYQTRCTYGSLFV